MEASKDSCQDRRERVNALGTEVVPDVRPIRNEVSGGPSTSVRVRPGNCTRRTALPTPAMRAVMPSWSCCGPGRVQHGALPLTSHGRGERYGEVG